MEKLGHDISILGNNPSLPILTKLAGLFILWG
jgi:hypothetical protein